MKKLMLLFILSLLTFISFPSRAQTGLCFIDLSAAAATLVQAQAQASSGDTAAAVAKLKELQAQLDAIIANCEGTSAVAPTPAPDITPSTPLIETPYTASNGAFSFTLPAGWHVFEQGTTVFIGSSQQATIDMTQINLPITEIGMALVVGTPIQLAPTVRDGANFVDVLMAYQTELRLVGLDISELTPITLNDNPGGRFIFQGEGFIGLLMIVEYAPDGLHLLVLVKAHPDWMQQIEQTLTEITNSVIINP